MCVIDLVLLMGSDSCLLCWRPIFVGKCGTPSDRWHCCRSLDQYRALVVGASPHNFVCCLASFFFGECFASSLAFGWPFSSPKRLTAFSAEETAVLLGMRTCLSQVLFVPPVRRSATFLTKRGLFVGITTVYIQCSLYRLCVYTLPKYVAPVNPKKSCDGSCPSFANREGQAPRGAGLGWWWDKRKRRSQNPNLFLRVYFLLVVGGGCVPRGMEPRSGVSGEIKAFFYAWFCHERIKDTAARWRFVPILHREGRRMGRGGGGGRRVWCTIQDEGGRYDWGGEF